MELLDACMSGLVLASSRDQIGIRPLDFVLTSDEQTIFVFADWWAGDWGRDFGFSLTYGMLVPGDQGWRLAHPENIPVSLSAPETDEERSAIEKARLRIDVDREKYLEQLEVFRSVLGSGWYKKCDEWISMVKARPVIDPVDAYRKRNTGLRDIGVITVTDQDGVVADALAIDVLGNAAAARDEEWLESVATMWSGYSEQDRPSMPDFFGWVQTQRPVGLNVEAPKYFRREGDVETIAFEQLPR